MEKPKPQYLIIGSDNFWYASCLTSMKDVIERIEYIRKHITEYGEPETDIVRETLPERFHIFKGVEIKQVYNEEVK